MGNSRKETIKYNHLNHLGGVELLDADYYSQYFSKHTHDGYETITMYHMGKEPQAIKMCLDFLQEHFQEKITLSSLSQLTKLSPY